jgi:hypothetical protein
MESVVSKRISKLFLSLPIASLSEDGKTPEDGLIYCKNEKSLSCREANAK